MKTKNNTHTKSTLAALAGLALAAGAAHAATPITILNAGFDLAADGSAGPPAHNGTAVYGWNQSGVAGAERTDTASGPTGDTDPELYFYLGGSIDQTVSSAWTSGDTFTLGMIAHNATWGTTGVMRVQLRLASDDTVLWDSGAVDVSGTVSGGAYTGTGHIYSWDIEASTFTAGTDGDDLNIRIAHEGALNTYPYIDDVSLSFDAVPEPSTTALFGLGGLALILRRRK
ncbi:MAG: PEP-CTERM sorting domain-containing protein [Akkermansiaceae bacterium]|nr:PEP-CTERM sorting domain-containing protein [Akkermansiaceae bacterium]